MINTVTALTTAIEHAAAERERTAGLLARLDVEAADLRTELGRAVDARDRATARPAGGAGGAARDAGLEGRPRSRSGRRRAASTSAASGPPARPSRTSPARPRGCGSLEEMDAARAAFGDGARMLLAGAHDAVGQHGALADYLDVDSRYERAVEAVLGDLLQHVVVDDHAQAHAGFALVRSQGAGRCGFIVTGGAGGGRRPPAAALPRERGAPADVVQVSGPFAAQPAGGDRRRRDRRLARRGGGAGRDRSTLPVVTTDGDVYRGRPRRQRRQPHRGPRHPGDQARDQGPARDGVEPASDALAVLRDEIAGFDTAIAAAAAAVTATVGRRPPPREGDRLGRGRAAAGHGRRGAGPPARGAGRGRSAAGPARRSPASTPGRPRRRRRLPGWSRSAATLETALGDAQRRLADARDHAQALSQRAAEARAEHAGLAERAAGRRWPRCSGSRRRRASCPTGPRPAAATSS